MSALLRGCSALAIRRPRLLVAIWGVAIVVSLPLAALENSHLSNGGFIAPGSESARVAGALPRFRQYNADALVVVLSSTRQSDAQPVLLRALQRTVKIIRTVNGVSVTPQALQRAEGQAALLPVIALALQTSDNEDVQDNLAVTLRSKLHPGGAARETVSTYFLGQAALFAALDELSKTDLIKAEAFGIWVVLAILLAVFGSLSAAVLPAVLGGGALIISAAAIYLLSLVTPVSIFATNMASLLGLGLAVDYSLFMLARYQRERRSGAEPDAAVEAAMSTSGAAILISGLTVLVSLAGLFLVDSTVVRSMAAGAVAVVLIAITGALTLTPVLMHRFGNRFSLEERFVPRLRARLGGRAHTRPAGAAEDAFWSRWAGAVMRRPLLAAGASMGLLLVLAIPALSMKVDDAALNQFPSGSDVRVGMSLLTKTFGAGVAGPVQVLVTMPANASASQRSQAIATVERIFSSHSDLGRASVELTPGGSAALIAAAPRVAPDGEEGHRLVSDLRRELRAASLAGAHAAIGGTTAETQDYNGLVNGSLWEVAVFIALATCVLLVALLRSIVLPLKAVVMTALTVAASYGVLVVCFQWRWFDAILGGGGPHYLDTLTPAFVLALTFGLSMDYQIFLLTRIREHYRASGDNALAVRLGLARSAATISSAAVIMVAVFAVFVLTSVPAVRQIGLGLAVAIALDATLVRLILVPAAMQLLGRWNWWFPRTEGAAASDRALVPR